MSQVPENEIRFGTPEEVYAVGAVIIAWNRCEWVAAELLESIMKVEAQTAIRICNLLGNQSRIDLLRLEGAARLTLDENAVLSSFTVAFGICLENRNLIAHSYMHTALSGLSMTKRSSKDRYSPNHAHFPTEDIMAVANTMYALEQYGFALYLALKAGPNSMNRFGKTLVPAPLPKKFPAPRKLTLHRP